MKSSVARPVTITAINLDNYFLQSRDTETRLPGSPIYFWTGGFIAQSTWPKLVNKENKEDVELYKLLDSHKVPMTHHVMQVSVVGPSSDGESVQVNIILVGDDLNKFPYIRFFGDFFLIQSLHPILPSTGSSYLICPLQEVKCMLFPVMEKRLWLGRVFTPGTQRDRKKYDFLSSTHDLLQLLISGSGFVMESTKKRDLLTLEALAKSDQCERYDVILILVKPVVLQEFKLQYFHVKDQSVNTPSSILISGDTARKETEVLFLNLQSRIGNASGEIVVKIRDLYVSRYGFVFDVNSSMLVIDYPGYLGCASSIFPRDGAVGWEAMHRSASTCSSKSIKPIRKRRQSSIGSSSSVAGRVEDEGGSKAQGSNGIGLSSQGSTIPEISSQAIATKPKTPILTNSATKISNANDSPSQRIKNAPKVPSSQKPSSAEGALALQPSATTRHHSQSAVDDHSGDPKSSSHTDLTKDKPATSAKPTEISEGKNNDSSSFSQPTGVKSKSTSTSRSSSLGNVSLLHESNKAIAPLTVADQAPDIVTPVRKLDVVSEPTKISIIEDTPEKQPTKLQPLTQNEDREDADGSFYDGNENSENVSSSIVRQLAAESPSSKSGETTKSFEGNQTKQLLKAGDGDGVNVAANMHSSSVVSALKNTSDISKSRRASKSNEVINVAKKVLVDVSQDDDLTTTHKPIEQNKNVVESPSTVSDALVLRKRSRSESMASRNSGRKLPKKKELKGVKSVDSVESLAPSRSENSQKTEASLGPVEEQGGADQSKQPPEESFENITLTAPSVPSIVACQVGKHSTDTRVDLATLVRKRGGIKPTFTICRVTNYLWINDTPRRIILRLDDGTGFLSCELEKDEAEAFLCCSLTDLELVKHHLRRLLNPVNWIHCFVSRAENKQVFKMSRTKIFRSSVVPLVQKREDIFLKLKILVYDNRSNSAKILGVEIIRYRTQFYFTTVSPGSPFHGIIAFGDELVSIGGKSVKQFPDPMNYMNDWFNRVNAKNISLELEVVRTAAPPKAELLQFLWDHVTLLHIQEQTDFDPATPESYGRCMLGKITVLDMWEGKPPPQKSPVFNEQPVRRSKNLKKKT